MEPTSTGAPLPQVLSLFRAHPWHGIHIGPNAPAVVNAFIEMTPTDTVKYELDKVTGLLHVDRPQRYSSVCPEAYGLIPQTFCGPRVAEFCRQKTGRESIIGDGDPLDVCVLTEKHIDHVNIFMRVRPIGGLRMIDGDEADDKIIAILEGDPSYGYWRDISQCPVMLTERLRHYFLTYKQSPDIEKRQCEITHIYGEEEAREVIRRSRADYRDKYGDVEEMLEKVLEVSSRMHRQ
ncbi:MAG: inorganic pyrophosphatase [Candidatus Hydrogenedentes bacterium]|nr:inorganic pyrophosphatase [Candidatus Hydrogenedentota bacterium]